MSEPNLTLYSYAVSPYAQKVRCYLLYKRLPFSTVYIHPLTAKRELPIGHTVPVLTCNSESRNESSKIGIWLDELYPEPKLLPESENKDILDADFWVSDRLIPAVFRTFIGYGESIGKLYRKRWAASDALNRTVPGGFSLPLRVLHLLLLGRAPFIRKLVLSTDRTKTNHELRETLAKEFETLLAHGPFLCGRSIPTLADLSAYPQVVFPLFRDSDGYFLPGSAIQAWVEALNEAVPELRNLVPEQIQ